MKIAALKIKKFGCIRQGKIQFKQHPILIGANNKGKTTVIEALPLLIYSISKK